jgi:DNA-binding protein H-NS
MDWGDVPTAAAAAVAVVAALVAFWQAREARRSRRATEQQAAEATNSRIEATKARIAAEHQASEATKAREVAEEALAMAKKTEADRVADRDARDAPNYKIVPDGHTHVRVILKEGPPGVVVRMKRLDIVAQGDERPEVPITLALDTQEYRLTPGGSCLMAVDVQIEKSTCSVRIELSSEEMDGGRVWSWRREVEFPAPPATARATRL